MRQVRENVALCEHVTSSGGHLEIDPDLRQRYRTTVDELVAHAHATGRIRENLTAADLLAMLAAAATAETRAHDAAPGHLADLIAASIFR